MRLLAEYIHAFGRFQRNARLYLISNALSGVTIGIVLVLYNLYLASLGYSTDLIGLVLFVATLGAALAIFPAGVCVDLFGGKFILIWASVLIGFAGAGQFLLRDPLPLLVSSFLVGVGGAFVLVVNAPFLTANSTPAERPQLFSLNIVLLLVTTVLGEFIGGALPVWLRNWPLAMAPLPEPLSNVLINQPLARSYQLALLIAGIISAPSFIPLFMMSDDRPVRSARTGGTPSIALRENARTVLARVRVFSPAQVIGWLTSPLAALIAVQALIGLGAGLFIPYFNLYFVQHLGASSALFGVIDGLANALNALLTLLAPLLALRIGKINAIALTRLLSIPLMLIIGLVSWLPLIALLYPLRQGAMDMTEGLLQVYSMEVVQKQHRGLANSSYQTARQVTVALSTPLGGLIIARAGFSPVFIIAAILYLLAIGLFWGRFSGRRAGEEVERRSNEEAGVLSRSE
ncbi:MAG: MFS transporter [Ktedonobacteraceae bacterium]|nr:MFS transporter [Ktedonobacteraceae bacterium]MBO0790587.1 MFS transporter [Ktedonobacteraceae bacterium]